MLGNKKTSFSGTLVSLMILIMLVAVSVPLFVIFAVPYLAAMLRVRAPRKVETV